MTEELKKRLIGAAVLLSLAVIFIPMLIEEDRPVDQRIYFSNIPKAPEAPPMHQFPAPDEIEQRLQDVAFGDDDSSIQPDEGAEVLDLNSPEQQQSVAVKTNQTPAKTRVGLSSWMVQVASFSSQDNANKVVSQLKEAGYDTFLESAQVKNLKVFRVRVGPEISKKNADRIAAEISSKFFLKPKVVKYP